LVVEVGRAKSRQTEGAHHPQQQHTVPLSSHIYKYTYTYTYTKSTYVALAAELGEGVVGLPRALLGRLVLLPRLFRVVFE
jgi:hypothetical protein